MRIRQWRSLVMAMLAVVGVGGVEFAHAQCGPMDVAFVVDTTGSMGGVLSNVTAELPDIITAVEAASGGDYRLALVEFQDEVIVLNDMASGNTDAVKANIAKLTAGGGAGLPEASDEAVATVVRGLRASDRAAGQQTGDFVGGFRPEAIKIIIMITDALPAGFDDRFVTGVDDVNVRRISEEAAARGIRISAIYTPTGDIGDEARIVAMMQIYSSVTSGLFLRAEEDGSGTGEAVAEIIEGCGGFGGTRSLILDPPEIALSNGETGEVKLVNFKPGDIKTLFYTASGLPEDSTVTFTPVRPETEGTDQQRVRVTIGSETVAGPHFVIINAGHTGEVPVQTAMLLVVVDCVPPFVLGTPGNQPASTTAGADGRATLKVVASGSPGFRYQWYEGHTGSTAFPIAGATSDTLITPAVTSPTSFWVRITNACGSRDSATAVVTPR